MENVLKLGIAARRVRARGRGSTSHLFRPFMRQAPAPRALREGRARDEETYLIAKHITRCMTNFSAVDLPTGWGLARLGRHYAEEDTAGCESARSASVMALVRPPSLEQVLAGGQYDARAQFPMRERLVGSLLESWSPTSIMISFWNDPSRE